MEPGGVEEKKRSNNFCDQATLRYVVVIKPTTQTNNSSSGSPKPAVLFHHGMGETYPKVD